MNTSLEEEKIFREHSSIMLDEAYKLAVTLPDNTVQVTPGGATFKTIQEAINSIQDASPKLEYQVAIGPGTYNERVKTKEYVFISGAGQDVTIINQHGVEEKYIGAIQVVANGGFSEVTINATGPHPDTPVEGKENFYCVGIFILTPGQYHIKAVTVLAASHNNPHIHVRGISNNTGAKTGYVIIGNSSISASSTNGKSDPVAIEGFMEGFSYYINFCEIATVGNGSGITTADKATVTVGSSTVAGQVFALNNTDDASLITANQCTINGPISPGVIVNP